MGCRNGQSCLCSGFPGENLHPRACWQPRMASKGPSASASPDSSSAGGPAATATAPVRAGARTARSSATSAWTQPRDARHQPVRPPLLVSTLPFFWGTVPSLKSLWPWTVLEHLGLNASGP